MGQVVLTAIETLMAREWREHQRSWRQEQRLWRAEDMAFREDERKIRQLELEYIDARRRYRDEDIRQRRVENSRYLWSRFVELNRRDVEEKSEQLRSLSWLTGLITSFTMTSPVEFNYGSQYISIARLTAYAVCTAIVPTLMTTSTILCVYLLGGILKTGKQFVAVHAEEGFMSECREYAESRGLSRTPPMPHQTFEHFWELRCEDDWKKSFWLFFWGVSFFLALLCTMGFIKFISDEIIAILFTVIIGVFFVAWLGTQVTWGAYLQKPQSDNRCAIVSEHIASNIPSSENPFKWHTRPKNDNALGGNILDCQEVEDEILVTVV
eukprot:c19726_g1_i1 orf=63-1034(+)